MHLSLYRGTLPRLVRSSRNRNSAAKPEPVQNASESKSQLLPATAIPSSAPTSSARLTALDGLLALAMVIWATNYSVAKAALDVLPPFMFNTFRFSLGALMLAVLIKFSGEKLALPRREWLPIIGISFLGNVIYQAFFLNGLRNTTVAHSVLINAVAPLGVVLVNIWRKQERGSRRIVFGVILVFIGVTSVVVSRYAGQIGFGDKALLGDFLSIIASCIWVASTLGLRGPLQRNSILVASFWMLAWGIVFTFLLASPDFLRFNWSSVTPDVIRGIFFSGCVSIAGASTIWNFGIKRLGTSRTAIFANLQPVLAALIAAVALGEQFTIWLVIGTAVVLFGMSLVRRG